MFKDKNENDMINMPQSVHTSLTEYINSNHSNAELITVGLYS